MTNYKYENPLQGMALLPAKSKMPGQHVGYSESIGIMNLVADRLGVNALVLGRLLGLPDPHSVFGYMQGRHRPGPLYLSRLIVLMEIQARGLDFRLVWGFDWQEMKPVWKKEVEEPPQMPTLGDFRTPSQHSLESLGWRGQTE